MAKKKLHTVLLSADEIGLLREALDSHMYWQLSSEDNRDSGYVVDIDAEDEDTRDELREAERLEEALAKVQAEIVEAVIDPASLGIDMTKDGWFTEYKRRTGQ